ncbi:MAG: NAD(P)-binding protein [Euryarchaeota archaeon]|nr:NAD(P)-binding protein [Euryarchaeota archaeon]
MSSPMPPPSISPSSFYAGGALKVRTGVEEIMPTTKDEPIQIMGAGLSGLASAIILAKAGREVHVHDIRDDSGARFDGDFQGIENWTSPIDFFDELRDWGIDPEEFKSTSFHNIELIDPNDKVRTAWSKHIAYRVIERGTAEHTIDQGLKRQALAAGANIHYKSRVKPEDCHIIASGPKGTSAVAYGEIFLTSSANKVCFQFNDKIAPGAYAYMIIIDGVGLICTCLWRKQKKSDRFLNESIAWFENNYPEIDRQPIKRVGGKGDFTINQQYKVDGRYFVGEAGGLQDAMWGFGMRYAISSGVFAAQDILGQGEYEKLVRKNLLPLVRNSFVNRWLMNRVGDKMFQRVADRWMKSQKKNGDGLPFVSWLFRPDLFRRILWPFVRLGMMETTRTADGRKIWRLPFRKALKRDNWEQSAAAAEVSQRWNATRKGGGKVSFTNDSDEVSIPSTA